MIYLFIIRIRVLGSFFLQKFLSEIRVLKHGYPVYIRIFIRGQTICIRVLGTHAFYVNLPDFTEKW